jgi:hypothetical protein
MNRRVVDRAFQLVSMTLATATVVGLGASRRPPRSRDAHRPFASPPAPD